MLDPRHRIRRLVLEVQLDDPRLAWQVQGQISHLQARCIEPLLDAMLSRFCPTDQLYRIDRLDLDLGSVALDQLERDLPNKLAPAVAHALQEQREKDMREAAQLGAARAPSTALELIAHFADTGGLPWWADARKPGVVAAALHNLLPTISASEIAALRRLLIRRDARFRLAQHCKDEDLLQLVPHLLNAAGIASQTASVLQVIRALLHASPARATAPLSMDAARLRTAVWLGFLRALAGHSASQPDGTQVWNEALAWVAIEADLRSAQLFLQWLWPALQQTATPPPAALVRAAQQAELSFAHPMPTADRKGPQPDRAPSPAAEPPALAPLALSDVQTPKVDTSDSVSYADVDSQRSSLLHSRSHSHVHSHEHSHAHSQVESPSPTLSASQGDSRFQPGVTGHHAAAGSEDGPPTTDPGTDTRPTLTGPDSQPGAASTQQSTASDRQSRPPPSLPAARPSADRDTAVEAQTPLDAATANDRSVDHDPSDPSKPGPTRRIDGQSSSELRADSDNELDNESSRKLDSQTADETARLFASQADSFIEGAADSAAVDSHHADGTGQDSQELDATVRRVERLQPAPGTVFAQAAGSAEAETAFQAIRAALRSLSPDLPPIQRARATESLALLELWFERGFDRTPARSFDLRPGRGIDALETQRLSTVLPARLLRSLAQLRAHRLLPLGLLRPALAAAALLCKDRAGIPTAEMPDPPSARGPRGVAPAERPMSQRSASPGPKGFASQEVLVSNAGLVVLWPFLPALFENLGLLHEQRFADGLAAQRAAGLLQHIASGETHPQEYQLALPKVLCGVDETQAFDFGDPVTDAESEECSHMLQAAIEHARVLGEASLAELREQLLLRSGVLLLRADSWLLRVEQSPYNILLQQFPWQCQWIRLPWLDRPMCAEW